MSLSPAPDLRAEGKMEGMDWEEEGMDWEVEGLDWEVEGIDWEVEGLDWEVEGMDWEALMSLLMTSSSGPRLWSSS